MTKTNFLPFFKLKKRGKMLFINQYFFIRNSSTSIFTATTLTQTICIGNTAAAGTRLALQSFLDNGFKLSSFQTYYPLGNTLVFFVATSINYYWVIYAPAASLEVVAISRAPSPEPNPNSPLPVNTMVDLDNTIDG